MKPSVMGVQSSQDVPFVGYPEKQTPEYLPSYDWGSDVVSDRHARIADAVWHIPGWLERDDALKLYELAFFARGPILEIGTYCGRSTVIMATAVADAGHDNRIVSVDIDPVSMVQSRRSAERHGVADRIVLVCADALMFLAAVPDFLPALVFVDGDHSESGVRADLEALDGNVAPGGLLLFHDYVQGELPDTDGFPVSPGRIEVATTVHDSWVARDGEFAGVFGQCGLFRLTS